MIGLGLGLWIGRQGPGGGSPPAVGELVAATAGRDGWTVYLDFYGLSPASVDPTKLSVALTYPATDYFGVALGSAGAIAGVASHASPWWDADNVFPTPYAIGPNLRVPVRVNKPIRFGDTGSVTVTPGLCGPSLAGAVALDCAASMLEHFAVVEANPDPLGGLSSRAESPYGCRRDTLTLFDPLAPSLPTGWTYSGTRGIVCSSAGADPLVGVDTNGVPIVFDYPAQVRDCIARNSSTFPTVLAAILMSNTRALTGVDVKWNAVNGGWSSTLTGGGGRGIYEQDKAGTGQNAMQYNDIFGTRDDGARMTGRGSKFNNNRVRTGGWSPTAGPHFDFLEIYLANTGFTDPAESKYNFFDSRIDGLSGPNYQWGRTSTTSHDQVQYGTRNYRNLRGVGSRELDTAGQNQTWIVHSANSTVNRDIWFEEDFMDKPSGSSSYIYAGLKSPSFFGTSKWSNMRDLRTGATVDDPTVDRRRSLNGDYRITGTGNRRIAGS